LFFRIPERAFGTHKIFGFQKKLVPVIEVPLGALGPFFKNIRKDLRRIRAVRDRDEFFFLADMRQEHRRRIAVPNLQEMDIAVAMVIINIDQELGRVADAGHGPERMTAPQNTEVGDRVELVKIGAGDLEEIPDHQVIGPGREEIREAVEHIENPLPLFLCNAVDLRGK